MGDIGMTFQQIENREIILLRVMIDIEVHEGEVNSSWSINGIIGTLLEGQWDMVSNAVSEITADKRIKKDCFISVDFVEDGEWEDVFWNGYFTPVRAVLYEGDESKSFPIDP